MSESAMTAAKSTRPPTVRYEFVPTLPGGRAVFPVERDGELIFLICLGEMTDKCIGELNEYADDLTTTGRWTQNWGGAPLSPPRIRAVS